MHTLRTKFVSLALAGTTLLSMSGALIPVAQAQSVSDLQAQISALLAQIQQLQSQLSAKGGVSASCSFSRDLTVGSKGDDVKCLQGVLQGKGYLAVAPTGYFGSLTKAAVAKWQAAAGVNATGYFGPKSRAAFAAMAAAPSPAPSGGGAPQLPAPASGLQVSLAADNPSAGALISGTSSAAARVRVLAVNFTAGTASGVTINQINLRKVGVLSDSSISGAYVTESGQVLSQYNSISGGVIVFSGLNLSIAAGQTREFRFSIDPATSLSAGNSVSFALSSASDVTAVDASGNSVVASGAFPFNGNVFTVTTVSNPSLATLTVASSSIGTQVTAGTTNNLVGAWNFTVTNSKVWLNSVKFRVIGSANKSDIRNVILKVNGNQVGSSLAQVSASGDAYFDISANPGVLNTGSNNIQLFADIMGSPSYDFQFEILNSYDILAVDSQYNVPIAAASNTGTKVSIQAGTVTVSQATDTPTGNLAKGQSGITMAKFTVYAAGEAIKVKWLGVSLTFTGFNNNTVDDALKNLALVDDAGNQIGTTINTLSTSATCTDNAYSNTTSTNYSYTNCYGNSSSPINYVVPANTTRVLSLRGDVQSTANFTTLQGKLTGNTSNLQGLTSSQTASSASVSGAALTLASASLTVGKNTSIGDQTLAKNSTGLKVGSYAFTASTAEGVTVNNVSFIVNGNVWANAKVLVGGVQFGTTQGTVASGTTYSFSGSPFTIPAGQTKYVDVYADSLSSASGSVVPATSLSGCSASGAVSLTSISCGSVNGQSVSFAGQSTVTIAIDSGTPAAKQLVMGSPGNSLAIFRFTETSNVEDIKITDLYVFDQVSSASNVKSAFGNVGVYSSAGSLLASGGAATQNTTTSNPGDGYYYKFSFASPVVVPRAGSISLTLKGDVSSYASSGATDNTTHVFKIATIGSSTNALGNSYQVVVALGSTSNASSAVSGLAATANTATVLRSKLTVTASALGNTSGRSKTSVDDLADITFAADAAGGVQIGSVKLTFSGSAPSTGAGFYYTSLADYTTCSSCKVKLYDTANGSSYFATASSSNTLTFNLANYQLSGGSSKSFRLRADSTNGTAAAQSGVSQTLTAQIAAVADVSWLDSLDSAANSVNIESYVVPINIQSVSYAQGT